MLVILKNIPVALENKKATQQKEAYKKKEQLEARKQADIFRKGT